MDRMDRMGIRGSWGWGDEGRDPELHLITCTPVCEREGENVRCELNEGEGENDLTCKLLRVRMWELRGGNDPQMHECEGWWRWRGLPLFPPSFPLSSSSCHHSLTRPTPGWGWGGIDYWIIREGEGGEGGRWGGRWGGIVDVMDDWLITWFGWLSMIGMGISLPMFIYPLSLMDLQCHWKFPGRQCLFYAGGKVSVNCLSQTQNPLLNWMGMNTLHVISVVKFLKRIDKE